MGRIYVLWCKQRTLLDSLVTPLSIGQNTGSFLRVPGRPGVQGRSEGGEGWPKRSIQPNGTLEDCVLENRGRRP